MATSLEQMDAMTRVQTLNNRIAELTLLLQAWKIDIKSKIDPETLEVEMKFSNGMGKVQLIRFSREDILSDKYDIGSISTNIGKAVATDLIAPIIAKDVAIQLKKSFTNVKSKKW